MYLTPYEQSSSKTTTAFHYEECSANTTTTAYRLAM